jgi:hypothetical protein
MSLVAPPINPASPPVGVKALDEGGFLARAIRSVKPDAIAEVRQYVQDEAEKNPLLAYTREFTDGQIAVAILAAVSRYNGIPPVAAATTVTPTTGMPFDIFLGLSSVQLFKTSYMTRVRNEVAYSDDGVAVDLSKSDKYMNALERFNAMHTEEARRYKISQNTKSLKSAVFSPYMFMILTGY